MMFQFFWICAPQRVHLALAQLPPPVVLRAAERGLLGRALGAAAGRLLAGSAAPRSRRLEIVSSWELAGGVWALSASCAGSASCARWSSASAPAAVPAAPPAPAPCPAIGASGFTSARRGSGGVDGFLDSGRAGRPASVPGSRRPRSSAPVPARRFDLGCGVGVSVRRRAWAFSDAFGRTACSDLRRASASRSRAPSGRLPCCRLSPPACRREWRSSAPVSPARSLGAFLSPFWIWVSSATGTRSTGSAPHRRPRTLPARSASAAPGEHDCVQNAGCDEANAS